MQKKEKYPTLRIAKINTEVFWNPVIVRRNPLLGVDFWDVISMAGAIGLDGNGIAPDIGVAIDMARVCQTLRFPIAQKLLEMSQRSGGDRTVKWLGVTVPRVDESTV